LPPYLGGKMSLCRILSEKHHFISPTGEERRHVVDWAVVCTFDRLHTAADRCYPVYLPVQYIPMLSFTLLTNGEYEIGLLNLV